MFTARKAGTVKKMFGGEVLPDGATVGARGLLPVLKPKEKEEMIALAKRASVALFSTVVLAAASGAAMAATTVHVSLWDKGADMKMVTGQEYEPGKTIDQSKATMGVKAMPDNAKPGVVTFKVTNNSKDTIHEMIVMKLDKAGDALPYVAAENRVDEDKAGDKGEVSELDPGASGSLTVVLQPGKYLLICNVPGHYASGMWTEFTVK